MSIPEATQTPLSKEDIEKIDCIVRLHTVGRLLCTLTEKHIEFLCQEGKTISGGKVTLYLGTLADPPPQIFSVFLLQFMNSNMAISPSDETKSIQISQLFRS